MSNPGEEGYFESLVHFMFLWEQRNRKNSFLWNLCTLFFLPRECVDGCGGNATAFTPLFFFFLPTWSFKPTQMSPSKNINIPGLSHRASPTMGDQEGINDPKLCYSKAHWLHTLPQVKGHHCLSLHGQINKGNTAVTLVLKFTRHIREAKWFCRRKIFYLILFSF